jgi:hypothetical protein
MTRQRKCRRNYDTNGLLIRAHGLDMVKFKNRDLTAIVR